VIDVRRLRDDPGYRQGAERKGADPATVDALLAAEERRRALLATVEESRAAQNAA
jgi:seryl-tRNA synthetase